MRRKLCFINKSNTTLFQHKFIKFSVFVNNTQFHHKWCRKRKQIHNTVDSFMNLSVGGRWINNKKKNYEKEKENFCVRKFYAIEY